MPEMQSASQRYALFVKVQPGGWRFEEFAGSHAEVNRFELLVLDDIQETRNSDVKTIGSWVAHMPMMPDPDDMPEMFRELQIGRQYAIRYRPDPQVENYRWSVASYLGRMEGHKRSMWDATPYCSRRYLYDNQVETIRMTDGSWTVVWGTPAAPYGWA